MGGQDKAEVQEEACQRIRASDSLTSTMKTSVVAEEALTSTTKRMVY